MTPATPDRVAMALLSEVVLLSAWLGAAAIVAAVVAPAAFAVLPARALAGALVGRVLPALFVSGIVVGVVAIVLDLRLPGSRARLVGDGVIALACVAAQFIVSPRITRLRETIGSSLDALASDDVRRLEFGRLHGVSVGLLGVAMVAAVVSLGLTIAAVRHRG
jgi:hypothetical protein